MTPERWERLKDIFSEALVRDSRERERFLVQACEGDADLLRDVRNLLQSHERVGDLPSSPGIGFSGGEEQPSLFQEGQLVAGRFRIVRFLARGGMGEVYEVEDQVLGQHVALKTIQPGLMSEHARDLLKHEIQSARRVTHPNVCRTYDIAEHTEPRVLFLTMELLDGPTLSRHLREHGPFSLEQALPLIEQIGAGLQAAHDAAVIHGDFKAGNVILTGKPDAWRPVITDFGLALSPNSRQQNTGLRAGTPGYMAPEQIEGKPATAATDVYAFGVVIAGMLGARRAPTMEGSPSLKAAALPVVENVTKLGPWKSVVERCLASDPARRFQKPSDVTTALRRHLHRTRAFLSAGCVVLVLLAVAVYWRKAVSTSPGTGFVTRMLALERAEDMFWDVSPDSQRIAASDWTDDQLVLRDMRGSLVRRLTTQRTPPGQVRNAVFSPDGKRVVYSWYSRQSSEMRMVDSAGGNDRLALQDETVARAAPAAWSPNGTQIAVYAVWKDGRRGLGLLSVATGLVRVVSNSDVARKAGRVVFSHGGNELIFDAPQNSDESARDIFAAALDGARERRLNSDTADDYLVGLSPDGSRLVFASNRSGSYGIWTAPLGTDLTMGRPDFAMAGSGPIAPVAVTAGGSLFYKVDLDFGDVYLAELDLAARTTISPPKQLGLGMYPSWSRNGEFLAFMSLRDPTRPALGVLTAATGATREVPVFLSAFDRPQWRTRETMTAFGSGQGKDAYFEINVHSGQTKLLVDRVTMESTFEGVWSADGNVWFNRFDQNTRGLFRYDFSTKRRTVVFVPSSAMEMGLENLALSPDGQFLAFQVRDLPKWETGTLMLLPTGGGDPRPLLSVRKPESFQFGAFTWLPDSKKLLVARSRGNDGPSELWLVAVSGAPPEKIDFPSVRIRNLRLSPDGKTIAFHSEKGELAELRVLENFLPVR